MISVALGSSDTILIGLTVRSSCDNVCEPETVPLDDLADLDRHRRREARSVPREGMKLAVFSARIDVVGQVVEAGLSIRPAV